MLCTDNIQKIRKVRTDQEMMDPLTQIALKHHTDKYEPHRYTGAYHRHLGHLRDEPVTLVEIGVASGGSIEMWGEYFTNWYAQIIGIDIDPDCYYEPEDSRLDIRIADGTKDSTGVHGGVDILIDDGSHTSEDILRAYSFWWPKVVSGGWYIIEDLKVQWRRDYGGGSTGSNVINTVLGHATGLMRGDEGKVKSLHIYDEIVLLEKN